MQFRHFVTAAAFVLGSLGLGPQAARADTLIGSYAAYIGTADLYNSDGRRLTEPWQVLRQDRANYHRFGIWQQGDDWDPWFGSVDNRAAMERMIMNGTISPQARRDIMAGGAVVVVDVYGTGNRIGWIEVDVYR